MALTAKQEAFAVAYISNGGNATAAYREAYDVKKMKSKTINEEASRLSANPKVAARIKGLLEPAANAARLTAERTLQHIAMGAYATPTDKIKWSDKVACLDKAARHLGLFERDNAQRAENLSIQIVAVGAK